MRTLSATVLSGAQSSGLVSRPDDKADEWWMGQTGARRYRVSCIRRWTPVMFLCILHDDGTYVKMLDLPSLSLLQRERSYQRLLYANAILRVGINVLHTIARVPSLCLCVWQLRWAWNHSAGDAWSDGLFCAFNLLTIILSSHRNDEAASACKRSGLTWMRF